jgi:P4 family phage/plasmid primase-like protien
MPSSLNPLKYINNFKEFSIKTETDCQRAELFAYYAADQLIWVYNDGKKGCWWFYDGCVWSRDPSGTYARRIAHDLYASIKRRFSKLIDAYNFLKGRKTKGLTDNERDQLSKLSSMMTVINRFGSSASAKHFITESTEMMSVSIDVFDSDPYLVNFEDGTLSLRDYSFHDHDPSDMLTQVMGCSYHGTERSERFDRFLNEIFQSDKDLIDYVQKVFGYSLFGQAPLEKFFIFYGATTRNGKSTILTTIQSVMGDYANATKAETWALKTQSDSGRASPDLAKLQKSRLVVTEEPNSRLNLNLALIKGVTGNDVISTRELYSNEKSWIAGFKLIFNTNFLPVFTDTTLFDSKRVNVIKFNRHFDENEIDTTLKDRFRNPETKTAIAHWMVEGFQKYQKFGLTAPQSVIEATEAYQFEGDKIHQFFAEAMVKDLNSKIKGSDVYRAYTLYCSLNGLKPLSKQNFFQELRKREIMTNTATINHKTYRNVVIGRRFSHDWILDVNPNTDYAAAAFNDEQITNLKVG